MTVESGYMCHHIQYGYKCHTNVSNWLKVGYFNDLKGQRRKKLKQEHKQTVNNKPKYC